MEKGLAIALEIRYNTIVLIVNRHCMEEIQTECTGLAREGSDRGCAGWYSDISAGKLLTPLFLAVMGRFVPTASQVDPAERVERVGYPDESC
ncbi:MAG: hypothetical protein IKP40_01240 [Clostridia bacterium]|nr:hypothetical protein [Clostridia bacterium]